jgi:hypothetical protein
MKKLTIKYPLKENSSGKGLNLSKKLCIFAIIIVVYAIFLYQR